MTRERLPTRRACEVFTFEHERVHYTAHVSRFADGRLAEVFLDPAKPGSALDSLARDMAVVASLAPQHGVLRADLMAALTQETDGTMHGPLGRLLQILEEGA